MRSLLDYLQAVMPALDLTPAMMQECEAIQLPKHYKCVLNVHQVKEIRATYRKGVQGKGYLALAKQYGVSPSAIKAIIIGRTWQNVTDDELDTHPA